ncbi:TolB-like translocation protein [Paraliomyxa miuraensis]|uniref:hypothetical protein n=1 Tax=Paraliomyxa miuraensis TaxID=376150 RepID=UPI0022528B87|nr:hypothetical protein [Paraliomyxa miuraensis]MCX4244077.1 hypothetical protein [Paraliomyxa miuraensis]
MTRWLATLGLGWALTPTPLQAAPAPDGGDVLGEIEVDATEGETPVIHLPPLLVRPMAGARPEVIALHAVVARDLELSGLYELDAGHSPPRADDTRPRVFLDVIDDGEHPPSLLASIERFADDEWTQREVVIPAPTLRDRPSFHRLTDRVLGELTGRDGAFAGRLAVVRRTDADPRLFHADPDGKGARVVTPPEQLVVATAFDAKGRLHYSASTRGGTVRLYREDDLLTPIPVEPRGSIYGMGFGTDGRMALSIGRGTGITVWIGKEPATLTQFREGSLDLHPVLGPKGRVAFAGEDHGNMRIFVGRRAISPYRGGTSSPTWCDHPDGARLVWVERSGKSSWVWSARPGVSAPQKILGLRGKISATTCSPDGRIVLFSYDGRGLEGPGVYLGNVDVLRPRRIMPQPARALAWGVPVEGPKPSGGSPTARPSD